MTIGFDVEAEGIALLENTFIEASAGTGKTHALKTLLIRLIIEKGLKVDQILVVTFTKLATLELKGRIREALKATLRQLKGVEKAPAFLIPYLQDPEKKGRSEALVRGSLALMEEVKIMTIHGFSARVINQYQESNKETSEAAIGSVETLLQLMKDFFRTEVPTFGLPLWQLERLIDSYQGEFDQLLLDLGHIALKKVPILCAPSYPMLCKELENYRIELSKLDLEEQLIAHSIHYKGLYTKEKVLKAEALEECKRLAAWSRGDEVELYFKELFKLLPENRTQKSKDVEPLYTELLLILQKMQDPLEIFAQIAERARLYLSQLSEKTSLLFYDDLLAQAKALVEKEEVQKAIQEEFRAAFIDEFQDTDSVQWALFSKLFLSQNSLVVVGDPKQSIYRFRQADLYTYMKAKASFTHHFSLTTNYRSYPKLVRGLNELCTPLPEFLLLPENHESFSCPKVEPRFFEGLDPSSLELWEVESEEQLFRLVAKELIRLQKEEGVSLSECAILVKDRNQMARLKKALLASGLSLQTMKEAPITESSAYLVLVDLIEALLSPHDLSLNGKVLLSPLFALLPSEVLEGQKSLLPLFFSWSSLLKERGLLIALQEVISHCREILFSGPEPLNFYSDFMQLVELGEESSLSVKELPHFYKRLQKNGRDKEELKPRRSVNKQAPLAMTIHMSKGLEFRVVFPIGLIAPITARRELIYSSKKNSFVIGEDIEEINGEKMRLFYVAITRAQERLYLPYMKTEKNQESKGSSSAFFMNQRLKYPIEDLSITSFVDQRIGLSQQEEAARPLLVDSSLPVPYFSTRTVDSFSSLFPYLPHEKEEGLPPAFPLGKEVGIVLHKVLEKISFRHKNLLGLKKAMAPWLERTLLTDYQDVIAPLVEKLFSTLLPTGFTLADLDEKKIKKELPFTKIYEERAIKGVIDLFFEHEGRYYFADWKSNYLKDETMEAVLEEMELCHYHEQAKLYKEAIEKYISFFDKRPFSESFGGYFYFFIRGAKVYYGK